MQASSRHSEEPPELGALRALAQLLRAHIARLAHDALPRVPPLVIKDHKRAQEQRQRRPDRAKRSGRNQRRNVLGRVLVAEDVRRDEAHEVREGHAERRERDAAALVRDVVVVPRAEEHGRRGRAPRHHEARKVRDLKLALDVDRRVDDEADEREQEARGDEREPDARVVGREGEDEQEDGPDAVRRDRVEVRLDCVVPEAADDLRHEERDGLQRDPETDLDPEPDVRGGHEEDLECVFEHERLVHDRGGVLLDALEGDLALLLGQEPGLGGRLREVEEGEDRNWQDSSVGGSRRT